MNVALPLWPRCWSISRRMELCASNLSKRMHAHLPSCIDSDVMVCRRRCSGGRARQAGQVVLILAAGSQSRSVIVACEMTDCGARSDVPAEAKVPPYLNSRVEPEELRVRPPRFLLT